MKSIRQSNTIILAVTAILSNGVIAADWPCYNADARRSAVTDEQLAFPLQPRWTYLPSQKPAFAWPEPGSTMHLLDFDYANVPVIAGGMVYFGSSADNSIYALDAATGDERWQFTTGGPIRFAPHIAGGKCYTASDDGYVYCLDAKTGALVWSFRAAPENRKAIGNDRMISRWPCRSGVLVIDDKAYVTAGMWPAEGIYVYCLDAASGRVIWCNDTSGAMYLPYPHSPSVSFGGPAPQGYLLSSKGLLIVPTGKAAPAAYDCGTGELRYYRISNGGSWVTIADDTYFTPRLRLQSDRDISLIGERGPQQGDGLGAFDLASGRNEWQYHDSYAAISFTSKTQRAESQIGKGLVDRQRVVWNKGVLYVSGDGIIEAVDCTASQKLTRIWSKEHPRTYSMALAGDALLLGTAGTVTALRVTDGSMLWQSVADGQVRGLAVADGRLMIATEKGTLQCFEPAKARQMMPMSKLTAAAAEPSKVAGDAVVAMMKSLPPQSACKGFALVVGEPNAQLAEALAARTSLGVICALTDKASVAAERQRLVRGSRLYGTRISIDELKGGEALPYAQYFANVIVVSGNAAGVAPAELFRVLRPCGGTMFILGEQLASMTSIAARLEIPIASVRSEGGITVVVRGKLPGAFDWDSKEIVDQRVQWPLELLWHGGPGPARMVPRHWKAPTPVFANGRYFALGQYHMIAVDAYNGCELWSRYIGGYSGYKILRFSANDTNVYVNFPEFCVRLDAQSGEIEELYGALKLSPRISLATPQTLVFTNDAGPRGTMVVRATDAALEMELRAGDLPKPSTGNVPDMRNWWELHVDVRDPEACFVGDDTGLFHLVVAPDSLAWKPGIGPPPPPVSLTRIDGCGTTGVLIRITWDDLKALTGIKPESFRFAATLDTYDVLRRMQRLHVFADGCDSFLNNGWAEMQRGQGPAGMVDRKPPVPVCLLDSLSNFCTNWPRQPINFTPGWTLSEYDRLEIEHWPPTKRDAIPATRIIPLTGLESDRTYSRSYGCGGTIMSATMDFFRSGTIAMYDRLDDSGMRHFGAIKPGCGMTMVPAGGIVVSSEGAADCFCAYNFQTSLAFAPAARRSNEDWALFNSTLAPSFLKTASLNFAAPGDRRDESGTLWLAYPRPDAALGNSGSDKPSPSFTFDIPCNVEYDPAFGRFRLNADRVSISGTDRPWIYTSGYRGIKRIELNLFYNSPDTAVALKSERAPVVDGKLDDQCWNGTGPLAVFPKDKQTYLRQDDKNLYIGSRQGSAGARLFSCLLAGDDGPACMRFSVSPDGSNSCGVFDYALDIPRLPDVKIDGSIDDWRGRGFAFGSASNTLCRFGWNEKGLLMQVSLSNTFHIGPTNISGMLAMFLKPGWVDFLELAVDPVNMNHVLDWRIRASKDIPDIRVLRNVSGPMHWGKPSGVLSSNMPAFESACVSNANVIVVEALLPWDSLKIKPQVGEQVAFQMLFYDPGMMDPAFKKTRDCRFNILAEEKTLCRLRLVDKVVERPYRVEFQPKGIGYDVQMVNVLMDERVGDPASWRAVTKRDGENAGVEMAIPWRTLEAAGIRKEGMRIRVPCDRPLSGAAQPLRNDMVRGAPSVFSADALALGRKYTVRLHFAEPDKVKRGDRVFDVMLQDKPVLRDFDIMAEAKGQHAALVKEFKGIAADKVVSISFVPKGAAATATSVPVISGVEVIAE